MSYGPIHRLQNTMIEEIEKDIYRIPVPLKGNPLRELNSYFIRGKDRDLLIDTGFRRKECREALEEGLKQLGVLRGQQDVLVTHFHPDHAGLADIMAGEHGRIYMSQTDAAYTSGDNGKELNPEIVQRFISEGFDREHMKCLLAEESDNMSYPGFADRLYMLQPHELIAYGDYILESIPVPGHTPGNMMLWAEKQGIMFCGDHILFDISPNIMPHAGVADSLGDYVKSLKDAAKYPVKLALPGHRKSGNYQERIIQLLAHYEHRLDQVWQIVAETPGLCAYEIAQKMQWNIHTNNWNEFPIAQQWFATGECMTHLDHLKITERIDRRLDQTVYRYFKNSL